ncbi:hypothetical protein BDW66DRAFT_134706 [Aspergillus desertorum]
MSVLSYLGPSSDEWTIRAQQHYSSLYRLDLGDLHRSKFSLWTNLTDPISTSLSASWARYQAYYLYRCLAGPIISSSADGSHITKDLLDGKGVTAHYFSGRLEGP